MAKEREIEEKIKEVLRRAEPDQSKIPALNQKNCRGDNVQINSDAVINQSGALTTAQDRQYSGGYDSAAKPISKKAKLPAGSIVVLPIIPFVITIGGSAKKNSDIFPNNKIVAIQNNIPKTKSDITKTPVSVPTDCNAYYRTGISVSGCRDCIKTQEPTAPDLRPNPFARSKGGGA